MRRFYHSITMDRFRSHMHCQHFHDLLAKKGVDVNEVLQTKSNFEFDMVFFCKAMGFASREEYYDLFSTGERVAQLRVPTLSISSKDDLLIPFANVPLDKIRQNEHIFQINVAGGGHIEYYHGLKCEFVSLWL